MRVSTYACLHLFVISLMFDVEKKVVMRCFAIYEAC